MFFEYQTKKSKKYVQKKCVKHKLIKVFVNFFWLEISKINENHICLCLKSLYHSTLDILHNLHQASKTYKLISKKINTILP